MGLAITEWFQCLGAAVVKLRVLGVAMGPVALTGPNCHGRFVQPGHSPGWCLHSRFNDRFRWRPLGLGRAEEESHRPAEAEACGLAAVFVAFQIGHSTPP